MAHVFIEDIAKAMGQDPAQLTALESRKYCILIDWALVILNHTTLNEPHTPWLEPMDIDDEQSRKIIDTIAKGLKAEEFKALDKQKINFTEREAMMETLCEKLGCELKIVDEIDNVEISYYDIQISKKGLVYTNSLTYQPQLNPKDPDVTKRNDYLKKAYDELKESKLFTSKIESFFTEKKDNQLAVNKLEYLSASKKLAIHHAPKLLIFYLTIIRDIKAIQQNQNLKTSEDDIKNLLNHITPLIDHVASTPTNNVAILEINQLLREILPKDKKDPLRPKIAENLSKMMVNHATLRNFKTVNDIKEGSKPIDRVILIGAEDLADKEVISSLEMILENHKNENIVVTFNVGDIEKVDKINVDKETKECTPFTLHAIGHGAIVQQKINANIGPYRGDAVMVGSKLAALVNKCPNINHVRLTGCFTGLMREDADLKKMQEKQRINFTRNDEHRRTLTMVTDNNLTGTESPFHEGTVAVSCWNSIDKSNRQISMTVSPGIIEPDKDLGKMMWKPTAGIPKEHEGIKEVRVTTTDGPKNKLKML